ncbi:putative Alpha-L-fucosidase [Actinacidiphila cocklensis]|uniref:Alpha-L-fucosidase n=1 Tax=Actinacidiphila cocklensis TaxID=887465 RepID=A0A9W4DS49_9ACTN|nr:putative Alpha-L-fucosidase [Actinacidiphila cocklensis]
MNRKPHTFGRRRMIRPSAVATTALLAAGLLVPAVAPTANAATATTAWQNGSFHVDTPNVVRRSDIVLGAPNNQAAQSLPLGNGSLGVAAWAAGGFTAQLNRADTLPGRKSPGQVQIPGLSKLTGAADFHGTLDLYTGVLTETGGGMTLKAWVSATKDELIVDVTGADPDTAQSATVSLWSGRNPQAAVSGSIGTLAETWVDNQEAGASGRTFGSLAALSAGGRNVSAQVVNSTQVKVDFSPNTDGSYRVIAGAPTWTGGNAGSTASGLLGSDATAAESSLLGTQQSWWANFWANSGILEANSADGQAQYMETLRTIYLFMEAASMRGTIPGSQAGVADMFNFGQDHQNWTPSATWLWNLRTQISANMSSGNFALNIPIFSLYQNNLAAIEAWTKQQMGGLPGACVPEVMRFNGNGGDPNPGANGACSQPGSPNWNALDITSGAEISLYVWQQYQDTGDLNFLRTYYPLMKDSAIFLLAYQKVGSDGKLHAVANAHETQWAVQDPTTDLAADAALFPVVVKAAQLLNTGDTTLINQLTTAQGQIPPWARTDYGRTQVLPPSSDAQNNNMIADSYQPTAQIRNSENIGLEPVWPYNLITDDPGALHDLGVRTYNHRPVTGGNDWSMDAIDAARLGLASEVAAKLVSITQGHQVYINGLADLGNSVGTEGYIEQMSGVATALNEALVQDYDGLLRIAPAWPSGWDAAGTVSVQGNTKVDVQVQGGTPVTVAIQAGSSQTMRVRNPWPGQAVQVVNGSSGAVVVASTTAGTINVPVSSGQSYLVERTSAPTSSLPYAQVGGSPATAARHLGNVQVGLDGGGTNPGNGTVISLRAHANGDYVTADNAGAAPLIANRTAIGPWEQFDEIDQGGGYIALRAHANNKYVTADNAGAAPLLAKVDAVGTWEQFQLIHNGDGSVSLKARVNNNYVTAENGGSSALIANRTAIGPWEEFDLITG